MVLVYILKDGKMNEKIQLGTIIKGMNNHEATITGGNYFFRISLDKNIWTQGVDPNTVIQTQVARSNNSQISMTFKNDIQYPTLGTQTFQVNFEQGRVKEIVTMIGHAS